MNNENLVKNILENLSDGVYFVDKDRNIQYWNKGAERITGYSPEEVIGKNCSDNILTHVTDKGQHLCKTMCPLAATIKDGQPRSLQAFLKHKDGHRIPVHISSTQMKNDEGKVIGGVECFFNNSSIMSSLRELEELKQASLICEVTGIGNRSYLERFISDKLNEKEWKKTQLTVIGFEIDNYENLKTSYNQQVIDLLSKMVARTLEANMQGDCLLGRWNEQLFLAAIPKMKKSDTVKNADRLRILVENSSKNFTKGKLSVTVSVGCYETKEKESLQSILDTITSLVEKSKTNSGNCVSSSP